MSDIILESVRAIVLLGIVIFLWNAGRSKFILFRKGWNIIIAGFGLLLMGSLIDITDNFEELNRFVIIGDTPTEAFLEKFVGFLGGFILLAIGLVRWIPDQLTERKRAEEALNEREKSYEKMARAVEQSSEMIVLFDPEDRIVFANQAWRQLNTVVEWTTKSGITFEQHLRALTDGGFVPEAIGHEEKWIAERLERHRNPSGPFELSRQDNKWISINEQVLEDGSIILVISDITERKRAEMELEKQNKHFNIALQHLHQGLCMYDAKGRLIVCNEIYASMYGLTPEMVRPGTMYTEIIKSRIASGIYAGTNPEDYMRERDDWSIDPSFTRKIHELNDGRVIMNIRQLMPNGGWVSTHEDITERKRAERALLESEELFSKAFQANPVPFSISGPEGAIYDLNEAFLTTMGYTREEAIGSSAIKLGVWADPNERAQFVELLQEKSIVNGYETQYVTKSGKLRDMVVSGEWIEVHGEPRLFIVSHDVTDSKAAESELTAHRDHLQEMVDRATQELRTKATELELALVKEQELSKLQREFVSMASHEFRTPLAIIDTTAQRMKRRADENRLTPEDAVRRVEKIRDAVGRMTRLMESTLDVASMEEGKFKVEIKPCDIGKVVNDACVRQQEISETYIISCDLADLPATIQADASALEQVLTNLLSNAVKYATDAPDIEVKAHTEDDQVVISVRDHGIGIDEDELGRIGERFFRARTSTGMPGTGIGLNLAKTLVEMHDGAINVESEMGEGSTFTIRLPIAGPDLSEQVDTRVA